MLVIRLRRGGRTNLPHYRIVVTEKTAAAKGKFIEILGSYDPLGKKIILDKEKVMAWMGKGAQPSNTVCKLLKKEGLKHKLIVIREFHAKPKAKEKVEKPASAEDIERSAKTADKTPTVKPSETKEAPSGQSEEKTVPKIPVPEESPAAQVAETKNKE